MNDKEKEKDEEEAIGEERELAVSNGRREEGC
jgi:hypothetical protein